MSKFIDFCRDLFSRSDDLPEYRPSRGPRYQTRPPVAPWLKVLLVIVAIIALGVYLYSQDLGSLVSAMFPTPEEVS